MQRLTQSSFLASLNYSSTSASWLITIPTAPPATISYGTMITIGVDPPNHVMAVTRRSSPSPRMALSTLLTMLVDGLLSKYQQKPAMWAKHGGHKWVKHGLGEYVGDTLSGLLSENELDPAALVLYR